MRKGIRSLLSVAVLTAGLCFGSMGAAAQLQAASAISEVTVADDTISYTCGASVEEITTQTQLTGKKKVVTDVYKSGTGIDLSYLKGKEATVTIFPKGEQDQKTAVHVNKIRNKIKAKFLPKTRTIEVTSYGSKVTEGIQYRTSSSAWKDMTADTDFSMYTTKGATLYIRLEDQYNADKADYIPYSKQIKLKVPAKAAGPKITIYPDTLSFSLPKGCECYFANGSGVYTEALNAVSMSAVSKSVTVKLPEVLLKGGINIVKDDSAGNAGENTEGNAAGNAGENTEGNAAENAEVSAGGSGEGTAGGNTTGDVAAILHVRKKATDKKLESKETIIQLPYQSKLDAAVIDEKTGIDFIYQLNANQTVANGVKVMNHGDKEMLVAVLPKDKTVDQIDLTITSGTDKITWNVIRPGRSYVISKKKAEEGTYLMYRIKGTAKNDKKKTELAFASTIVVDSRAIAYPKAPASDLGLSFSLKTEETQTPSGTALKVTPYTQITQEGTFYAYEVTDQLVKNIKINAVKTSGYMKLDSLETEIKVTANAGQYITVYLLAADGKILAYGSKQVTASVVY